MRRTLALFLALLLLALTGCSVSQEQLDNEAQEYRILIDTISQDNAIDRLTYSYNHPVSGKVIQHSITDSALIQRWISLLQKTEVSPEVNTNDMFWAETLDFYAGENKVYSLTTFTPYGVCGSKHSYLRFVDPDKDAFSQLTRDTIDNPETLEKDFQTFVSEVLGSTNSLYIDSSSHSVVNSVTIQKKGSDLDLFRRWQLFITSSKLSAQPYAAPTTEQEAFTIVFYKDDHRYDNYRLQFMGEYVLLGDHAQCALQITAPYRDQLRQLLTDSGLDADAILGTDTTT